MTSTTPDYEKTYQHTYYTRNKASIEEKNRLYRTENEVTIKTKRDLQREQQKEHRQEQQEERRQERIR